MTEGTFGNLGTGDDVLDWHGTQAVGGTVDLGEGANTRADGDGGAVAIDASQQPRPRIVRAGAVQDTPGAHRAHAA